MKIKTIGLLIIFTWTCLGPEASFARTKVAGAASKQAAKPAITTSTSTSTERDRDHDTLPDALEEQLGTDSWLADTDGDGIQDAEEIGKDVTQPLNTDKDRRINALDTDDDGDGIPTILEGRKDTDGDGRPDYLDNDSDNDGKPDRDEAGLSGQDDDRDGVDNVFDTDATGREDANGDGIDAQVSLSDADQDGTPDVRDAKDTDGKAGDLDQDGVSNDEEARLGSNPDKADSDGDGVPDGLEVGGQGKKALDTDGDGKPDILDTDDDGDGLLTALEVDEDITRPQDLDTDKDGVANYLDSDDDGDGKPTLQENTNHNQQYADDDSDKDGIPDYLDKDDAGGLKTQAIDAEKPQPVQSKAGDTDGDGFKDEMEIGLNPEAPVDTDGDGIPDFKDDDDDGDGIPTLIEGEADRDGDGRVNYLDVDPSGYFYCASDGRIVSGIKNFTLLPTRDVELKDAAKDGIYNWKPKKPGTYTLQFVLPKGMRTLTTREKGHLYVTSANGPLVNLGMGEDIARPGYLAKFKPDELPVWYSAFVIQQGAPSVINHNIPLIGGTCGGIKE